MRALCALQVFVSGVLSFRLKDDNDNNRVSASSTLTVQLWVQIKINADAWSYCFFFNFYYFSFSVSSLPLWAWGDTRHFMQPGAPTGFSWDRKRFVFTLNTCTAGRRISSPQTHTRRRLCQFAPPPLRAPTPIHTILKKNITFFFSCITISGNIVDIILVTYVKTLRCCSKQIYTMDVRKRLTFHWTAAKIFLRTFTDKHLKSVQLSH